MLRKVILIALFVTLILIFFIAGVYASKSDLFSNIWRKDEILSYKNIGNPNTIKWSKQIAGNYQGIAVDASIEIDETLYSRNKEALIGFKESAGTWQDVGNTVAAFVTFFPIAENGNRIVNVNMELKKNGNYIPVEFSSIYRRNNTKVEFNPNIPVRFIYFNADENSGGVLLPLNKPAYTAGWGVDPKSKGLVIFIGMPITGFFEQYKGGVYGANIITIMALISGAAVDNTTINEEKRVILYQTWLGQNGGYTLEGVFADN